MEEDTKVKNAENTIDCYITSPDYGELIIEMVQNIDDSWILKQIYRYIKNITKAG